MQLHRWHVFASQFAAATIAVFLVASMSRYTVLEGVGSSELAGITAYYAVSIVVSPFLYVDTTSRAGTAKELQYAGTFDAIEGIEEWTMGIDMMPTCPQFARIAASAQCAHRHPMQTKMACVDAVDQDAYVTDCHVARSLWVCGATLTFVAVLVLVWRLWTHPTEPPSSRALITAGCMVLCAAIVFTVYTIVFVEILNSVSTIVTTDGISDIASAEMLLTTLTAMLFVTAGITIAVGLSSRTGAGVTSGDYTAYTVQYLNPLFG